MKITKNTIVYLTIAILLMACLFFACTDDATESNGSPQCEGLDTAASCQTCIHQGLVQGKLESATCEYLGIPYAKPPIGELRFAAPQPADGWTDIRDATLFGPACIQGGNIGGIDMSGTEEKSEDCLFVNVWTPSTAATTPLPVMVFIYGGGYAGGGTNAYVGRGLSESGQVVVASMNYRHGAIGFFTHPALDSERPDAPSGSDGIRDQQLALQWVKDNIASFGGDPNNVTLFGESAGSSSVCNHMVSPGSRDLINRFILESGVCVSGVLNGIEPNTKETMYDYAEQLVEALCPQQSDVMACLRALPAEDIMGWVPEEEYAGLTRAVPWGPVIDGPNGVIPEHPDKLFNTGNYHKGEVVVGSNKNEYALFALARGNVKSIEELTAEVELLVGDRAEEVVALYAPASDAEAAQTNNTIMTDAMFRCASRRFARAITAQGSTVYLYSFDYGPAMHGDELAYVFGQEFYSLAYAAPLPALFDAIQEYWTNFARNGDPNGDDLVSWPVYDAEGDQHIILTDTVKVGAGLQKATCDFWDAYLANR